MLIFGLESTILAVLQAYAPNEPSDYTAFLQEVEAATQMAAKADHFILMGDFNAHVGNDAETWRGVIRRNGLSALNLNGELLLDFCCAHDIAIMNTFFQHKDIYKYTWYRDALEQKSQIDFAMVPMCTRKVEELNCQLITTWSCVISTSTRCHQNHRNGQ